MKCAQSINITIFILQTTLYELLCKQAPKFDLFMELERMFKQAERNLNPVVEERKDNKPKLSNVTQPIIPNPKPTILFNHTSQGKVPSTKHNLAARSKPEKEPGPSFYVIFGMLCLVFIFIAATAGFFLLAKRKYK